MARVKTNEPEKYNSPFASRLRWLLERDKVSQSKLAEVVGVTRQAISSYSLGASLPDIDKFEKIADFFKVSTDYLLGRTDATTSKIEYRAICEKLNITENALTSFVLLRAPRPVIDMLDGEGQSDPEQEKLDRVFSLLLEAVNWQGVCINLLNALKAEREYGEWVIPHQDPDRDEEYVFPEFTDAERELLHKLQGDGYTLVEPYNKKQYYLDRLKVIFSSGLNDIFDEEQDLLHGYEDLPLEGAYLPG